MSKRGHDNDSELAPGWYPDPDRPGVEIYFDGKDFPEDIAPRKVSTGSSVATRLAIALGVLFLFGALAATFLPASPSTGGGCGTWIAPEYDREEVGQLVESGQSIVEDSAGLGMDTSDLQASTLGLVRAYVECDEALGTRRTLALGMLGLAVLLPGAVLFVAGRRD